MSELRYETSTNHIISRPIVNTDADGWEERVRRDIRHCIENEFIHNYIKDTNGNKVFDMYPHIAKMHELRKKHGVTSWMNETPDYKFEKKVLVGSVVEDVFARLCACAH